MTQTKHTPTPYHVGMKPGPMVYAKNGTQVADLSTITNFKEENAANAAFIVTACNAHEYYERLLKRAADSLQAYCAETNGDMNDSLAMEIEAALAKANQTQTMKGN